MLEKERKLNHKSSIKSTKHRKRVNNKDRNKAKIVTIKKTTTEKYVYMERDRYMLDAHLI